MIVGTFVIFLFAALVIGLLGLMSKSNRKNKEYVGNVKSTAGYLFMYTIGFPLFFIVGLGSLIFFDPNPNVVVGVLILGFVGLAVCGWKKDHP